MRREFPDRIKLLAWHRSGGFCENALCQAKLYPGKFIYDHRIPDQLGGEPSLGNCMVICKECDKAKTRKDQGDIAKAKRREKKNLGIRKRSTFACSRQSPFKKRIDGTVVRRDGHHR